MHADIIGSIAIASAIIIFGIVFFYCVKSTAVSLTEQFKLLRDITSYASLFIERRYPHESLVQKKKLIHQLSKEMLKERLKGPITLDALVDASVRITDTDMRMIASEADTQQTLAQRMPPNGMRQRAVYRTGRLTPL